MNFYIVVFGSDFESDYGLLFKSKLCPSPEEAWAMLRYFANNAVMTGYFVTMSEQEANEILEMEGFSDGTQN